MGQTAPAGRVPTYNYNAWLKEQNCRHEWQEDVLVRRELREAALGFWKRFAAVPEFDEADQQGLTFLAIARAVQHFLYPRGQPLSNQLTERAAIVSFNIGAEPYRLPEPRFMWTTPLREFTDEWLQAVLHPACLRASFDQPMSPRDVALCREFDWICLAVSLPHDSDHDRRVGRRLAETVEYVGKKDPCTVELAHSLLMMARNKLGGWGAMMYADDLGVLRVGERQARDAAFVALGVSRPRKKKEQTLAEPPPPTILSTEESRIAERSKHIPLPEFDEIADEDANAVDAVSRVEALARMREQVATLKAQLKVGTVAHAVADYVIPYYGNEVSLADVAAATGVPEKSASKELVKLGKRLAGTISRE